MVTINKIKEFLKNLSKQNDEILWANIWRDTVPGIKWLAEFPIGISPGRWAVGYNYIYIVTRILDDIEPHKVLDIGLGISSKLISNYFNYNHFEEGEHLIFEHDQTWVDFYLKKNRLSPQSRICIQTLVEKNKDGYLYHAYENISGDVKGKKFSFISIDAPFGSEKYSRRDIVDFLPDILEKNFVIIIDDANRKGEMDTVYEIQSVLKQNKIGVVGGVYSGMTDCYLIASENYKFLVSL